jgi:hypothetical protein
MCCCYLNGFQEEDSSCLPDKDIRMQHFLVDLSALDSD